MSNIGQCERLTQNRIVPLFGEQQKKELNRPPLSHIDWGY